MLFERDHWNLSWTAALLLAMVVVGCQPTIAKDDGNATIAATAVPHSSSPMRESLQCDPANSMRIYRPPGGFKKPLNRDGGDQDSESVAPSPQAESQAPVFFADRVWADRVDTARLPADLASPAFAQVLDGFSDRWQHRLGTPVTCAMVLCQGSCAASDSACELAGSWRGESSGCAAMPAGATESCGADDRCSAAQNTCSDTHDCCAQGHRACAEHSAGCAKGNQPCAEHGTSCSSRH